MLSLKDKVAIITGAGSGIGRASAVQMSKLGAAVVVADIAEDRAATVAEEITRAGGRAIACSVDVAEEDQIRQMVNRTVAQFGGVDILHNNAADVRPETYGRDTTVTDMETALWDSFMAINLRSVMLGCKWAIPEMLRRGGGSIVNTSSMAASAGQDVTVAYGVSKAGVNALTQYVATQYGKQGIRCNAIAPGYTLTNAGRAAPREFLDAYKRNTLTPYLGEPEDLANVAAFLASDASRYITGQIIAVDGGITAHTTTVAALRDLVAVARTQS